MTTKNSYRLFSGTSHPALSEEISKKLGIPLGKVDIKPFPDGEIGVQILENVRGQDVFVIQSIARKPNLYLMELLIMVDALKRASAKSVVAVLPYYGYCRQDRRDKGRVPITAKLVADMLERAGVTRVLTMDLHSEQIQGFFDVPVDNLYARPIFVEALRNLKVENPVVVTPDVGSIKLARALAQEFRSELAIVDKRRLDTEHVETEALIGEVEGRDVMLIDDILSTGATLKSASAVCKARGAKRVFAAITHGLMSEIDLEGSSINKLFLSNTIPLPETCTSPKLEVLSSAKLFAQAIQAIVEAGSMSSLYD